MMVCERLDPLMVTRWVDSGSISGSRDVGCIMRKRVAADVCRRGPEPVGWRAGVVNELLDREAIEVCSDG